MSVKKPDYPHHTVRTLALQKLNLEDQLKKLESTHRDTIRWIAEQGIDVPQEFIQPMYKH